MTTPHQIALITSLFKARSDVFAIRWEKEKKSGYYPAQTFDPYHYKIHKIQGGSLANYASKEYRKLTDAEIEKHLCGQQFIGIYPLLQDNTSWFIVADFDKENWAEECRIFLKECTTRGIPAYLERSRSGKGGHVWIFFEKPYLAAKSRKIVVSILQQAGLLFLLDRTSSFDRLFPNQDMHQGKGFGNLIAMPFNKTATDQGNCCFVDPETLLPFPDQFGFLGGIKKIPHSALDLILAELNTEENNKPPANKPIPVDGKPVICLRENIYISKNTLPLSLVNFLKEELNFANAEFFVKKNMGKSTWDVRKYIKLFEEDENHLIIPRGFIKKIIQHCNENRIEIDFRDERKKLPEVKFSCHFTLYPHQILALEATSRKNFGVIVSPPGTGKTIIALKVIADKQQPALILVHRKQLADQWIERIQSFMGIPKHQIGFIGQGKNKIGKAITVAMIQSLGKVLQKGESSEIIKSFGTIIVDECHHIPAETYSSTISKIQSYFVYGLTATPFRKYSDGKQIFVYLGEVISEMKSQEISTQKKTTIILRETTLDIPFNSKTDRIETLSKVLVHDSARNKLILEDVVSELNSGKRAVIITERREHIESLNQYLKQQFEVITLSGEDNEASRSAKWKTLKEGNYKVLITTGQYFGEGTDLKNAECLFLVYPFSFEGKLIQYIGRVQRGEVAPTIYDYRDVKIDYLNKLFLKRNTYYRKLEHQATLFDESGVAIVTNPTTLKFEKRISLAVDELEFRYGTIAFRFQTGKMNRQLEFEIENDQIRPEFEVLKPYFKKALRSLWVRVDISFEYHEGVLISQLATSQDIDRINQELIDTVRFQFVTKNFFGKGIRRRTNLLDLSELQNIDGSTNQIYESENELLDEILKRKQIKHYRQIRYLAEHHEFTVLKVRFVLSPFSFVFLLSGDEFYHIILETMDTEEATYIWHVQKSLPMLKQRLKEIDSDLGIIRNEGRQAFLEKQPENFSRILHDYTDEKKGFALWKGLLEERLG
ncbi:MAG: DEAD/DEAH box helicase [Bacteroidetes bacterium]|nr:DEAD/DEAH box helicase [Bacteroidota bacterium]